jgi:hypothetical protein
VTGDAISVRWERAITEMATQEVERASVMNVATEKSEPRSHVA